jgi:hypothetical protein
MAQSVLLSVPSARSSSDALLLSRGSTVLLSPPSAMLSPPNSVHVYLKRHDPSMIIAPLRNTAVTRSVFSQLDYYKEVSHHE